MHKTIDLFAGIGGIRQGFEKHGFSTVYAVDSDQQCKTTYDMNFKETPLTVGDVREVVIRDIPDFDFLLGGFPCQAFSVAGEKKGFGDTGRGDLFFHIASIIKYKKPLGFFLENVRNLKGHKSGKTFSVMLDILSYLGYDVCHKIMNTKHYGNLPQNRERIYIVGFKKDTGIMQNFTFPRKQPLRKTVQDILQHPREIDTNYYYNNTPLYNRIKHHKFRINTVYQWRRKYVRENKSGVCPTLTANMGTGGHNVPIVRDTKGLRKLTPLECARFQGFPRQYKLPNIANVHLYKQIGNSVSVPVVNRIARQVYAAMT